MPYNILHVFPSDVFTGTVAHVLQVAGQQQLNGCKVFLATDMSNISEKYISYQVPVTNRTFLQRFKNIREIVQIIRTHHIDIVHSHSRAASWISYYAALWTKCPQVSTIHGRQHKHKRFLKKVDVYGSHIISICPNLSLHLENEIGLNTSKIKFIPNGINFNGTTQKKSSKTYGMGITISVISRFNGAKGKNVTRLLTDVFPLLLSKYPTLKINLIGAEWERLPSEGKTAYHELQVKYGVRIDSLGFQNDILSYIIDADLVIGSGRVAMESALLNVPVLVLGESFYHGILCRQNIKESVESNFGDIWPTKYRFDPDNEKIRKDLEVFLSTNVNEAQDLTPFLQQYDLKSVVNEITNIYQKAIVKSKHPKHIPILLYHKITDDVIKSKHRTYVTRRNFIKQMHHLSLRGMTPITFKEYDDFVNGQYASNKFPHKPVILTFDDGYADNYRNALPILNKYNFKGVLFLVGNTSLVHNSWDVGENLEINRLLTHSEISEFIANGWEIGAHTVSHPDLTVIPPELIICEVIDSKKNLENLYRTKIISFAYPYGKTNEEVKKIVKESGFQFGITTNSGGKDTIEDDRFEIFRVNIYPEDGLFQFHKKISHWYRGYYKRKRGK
jgi:peptidoglycan/xylan/chitin deacetylase (PgdA/CDA1 family)/UDP-N-acetylglucosamine:LPS N-acetylglucosamine transferase